MTLFLVWVCRNGDTILSRNVGDFFYWRCGIKNYGIRESLDWSDLKNYQIPAPLPWAAPSRAGCSMPLKILLKVLKYYLPSSSPGIVWFGLVVLFPFLGNISKGKSLSAGTSGHPWSCGGGADVPPWAGKHVWGHPTALPAEPENGNKSQGSPGLMSIFLMIIIYIIIIIIYYNNHLTSSSRHHWGFNAHVWF